jgi:hypothetical protein
MGQSGPLGRLKMGMFGTAKEVGPTKKAAKGKKDLPKNLPVIEGLEKLAALRKLQKALKGIEETLKDDVDQVVADMFLQQGMIRTAKPDNFNGKEGKAEANHQLKDRSSASALSDIELSLLTKYGISTEIVGDVHETFIVNPEYANDQKMLEKVEKALEKVPGLPKDFIQKQVANKKTVITKTSIDECFRVPKKLCGNMTQKEVAQQLLPVVAVIAHRTSFKGKIEDAMAIVQKELEKNEGGDE